MSQPGSLSQLLPKTPETDSDSQRKRVPKDFEFGDVIGEGSFSTVLLAKEVSTNQTFAVFISFLFVFQRLLNFREKPRLGQSGTDRRTWIGQNLGQTANHP
jgi:hypothetical protein